MASIKKLVNSDRVSDEIFSKFCTAVRDSNFEELGKLVSEYGVDVRNYCGMTTLHSAAQINNKAAVIWLLERGADIEAKTEDGATPAIMAAMDAYHNAGKSETLDELVSRGANMGHQNKFQYSAQRFLDEAPSSKIDVKGDKAGDTWNGPGPGPAWDAFFQGIQDRIDEHNKQKAAGETADCGSE